MSRFISANADPSTSTSQEEDSRWLAAQAAIEATRTKPRLEPGSQEGGKSLFETLQANKEKKQALYEDSLRITNQFQALDADDVKFLDSVLESTRAREEAVKRETRAQLEAFRAQQLELERASAASTSSNATAATAATATATSQDGSRGVNDEQTTSWTVSRKRKKTDHHKAAQLGGVKLRKTSSSTGAESSVSATEKQMQSSAAAAAAAAISSTTPPTTTTTTTKTDENSATTTPSTALGGLGLGLGAYSSSDEDD